MSLDLIVIDWETAYGKHPETGENVTLSKMTTEEYVRHPLFKVHGLGVKINGGPSRYIYRPAELLHFLQTTDWSRAFVVAHHAHFDGAILSWRAGIRPAFWGCTLSMARALFPHEAGSLANVSRLLGLGEKGHELVHFSGKWVMTEEDQRIMGGYCRNDVDLTAAAFQVMKKDFPPSELRLVDLTVRLFTEPVLEVERGVLIAEYKRERYSKRALLKQCGTDKKVLASGDKFAALLLSLGVDPPKKLSPSKVKDGRVDPENAGVAPLGLLPSFRPLSVLSPEEKTALRAEKDSYPWAYAFGKADEEFKLLLDHPDAQVQAVVGARLGVKSTLKETRSKRFYKIGTRGAFPVYHNYYGARTGRDSGGDKQNTTNLNRVNPEDPTSGALRRSLLAPPGHVLVVRDLGQIEARKLAYVAGQEDLLELFRSGGDPYNRQASLIFGYEVDRKKNEFWLEGMAGKASVLGCFGADTKVLTNRGWVSIVAVTDTDTVWDGVEFVRHAGVIAQGEKECLTAFGVTATPDHEILTEHSWAEWQSVLTNRSLFRSAIRKGSLPSRNGETGGEEKARPGTLGLSALAGGRGSFPERTSKAGALPGVISVLRKQLELPPKNFVGTPPLCLMTTIARGCLTAFRRAFSVVTTRRTSSSSTTAGAVFASPPNGGRTEPSSSATCALSQGGMLRTSNSTERTTTKGMNQGTCDSSHAQRTLGTEALWGHSGKNSAPSEKRTMTYDIACAGPRSRFTILSTEGPLIVHNCGYQMGWGKFQESLRVGFMGMPPILFDAEAAHKLGADIDAFCHQRSYKKGCGTLREEALSMKPLNIEETPHLWHCAAVKQIVDRYRESNGAVVAGWREAGQALRAIEQGYVMPVGQRGLVSTCKEGFLLPNGMKIRYNKLRSNESGEFRYLSNVRKKEWSYIYGGKAVENIIQALARVVLTDQMLSINRWLKVEGAADRAGFYQVVTSTYDEVVCCVPAYRADECLEMMKEEMRTAPSWCPDLPLKSSGGYAENYGDCEK